MAQGGGANEQKLMPDRKGGLKAWRLGGWKAGRKESRKAWRLEGWKAEKGIRNRAQCPRFEV